MTAEAVCAPAKTPVNRSARSCLPAPEMREIFSFQGVRSLPVLYLVDALQYARADALSVLAMYTGSAFFCVIFGGWLAARAWASATHWCWTCR